MGRIARIVVPGLPHHVTQRGNRREPIFFPKMTKRSIAISSPNDRGNPSRGMGLVGTGARKKISELISCRRDHV